jgi:hypothetical protein
MKSSKVKVALQKLAKRRDVERRLQLNKVGQDPALAHDREYQRKFIGYYRMGRKKPEFYKVYFSMLEKIARAPSPPPLADILQELYDLTAERHLSFASKMRGTVTDAVLFDKNLATYFRVPSSPLPQTKDWLATALRRIAQVEKGIRDFIQKPEWPPMRALFDQSFPDAAHLSDITKADLIIWAAHEP